VLTRVISWSTASGAAGGTGATAWDDGDDGDDGDDAAPEPPSVELDELDDEEEPDDVEVADEPVDDELVDDEPVDGNPADDEPVDDDPADNEAAEVPAVDTDDAGDDGWELGPVAELPAGAVSEDRAEAAPVVSGEAATGAPSIPISTGEEPWASPAGADDDASSATVDVPALRLETTGMVSIRAVTATITAAPISSLLVCCRARLRSRRRNGGRVGR